MSSNKTGYNRAAPKRHVPEPKPVNTIELIEIYIDEDGEEIDEAAANQKQ